MRTCLIVILIILTEGLGVAQPSKNGENLSAVKRLVRQPSAVELYREGIKYKNGAGVAIDYKKAYAFFEQAAKMGDAQSLYAQSYMEYKNLGEVGDYVKAAKGFQKGAEEGRDNSMYFYSLCLANGYGVAKNADSAKYWLEKAAAIGYKQAIEELKQPHSENANDSASSLLGKINQSLLPKNSPLNEFTLVEPQIPSENLIDGTFKGYVLHYDWSGNYLISSEPLELALDTQIEENTVGHLIKGFWTEKGQTSIPIEARLSNDSIIFEHTEYKIKDHYSWDREIKYDFTSASLNLNQTGDSVFLYGNVQMFSPDRNEPAKPIFLALVRTDNISSGTKDSMAVSGNKTLDGSDNKAQILNAKLYPNPFKSNFITEFTLTCTANIALQLLNMNGMVVYKKEAQQLKQGKYTITISPGRLASGMYILRIINTGNNYVDLKAIRE